MIYALNTHGIRVLATPGARGTCPGCDGDLVAKCGLLVTNHWAHLHGGDCDTFADTDSEWRRSWQSHAPEDRVDRQVGSHQADLVTYHGKVLKIRDRSITAEEIGNQESFYGEHMAWLFDARNAFARGRLDHLYNAPPMGPGQFPQSVFRWSQPRRTIRACRRPVFLDLGEGVLRVNSSWMSRGALRLSGQVFMPKEFEAWLALPTKIELADQAATAVPGVIPFGPKPKSVAENGGWQELARRFAG